MIRTSKKASPAKKPGPNDKSSSQLVNSIIRSAVSSANKPQVHPTTPNSSPVKRKKAVVISDDDSSGIEMIEGPLPSPKKARPATPPPGSEEFQSLPPVSFAGPVKEKVSEGTNMVFGSNRPVRTRSQTEKGIYYAENNASKAPSKKKTTAGQRNKKSAIKTNPTKDGASANSSAFPDTPKTQITVKMEPISEDDMPEVSELLLSSPKKKRALSPVLHSPTNDLLLPDLMFDLESKDEQSNGSEHSPTVSEQYLATDDDGSVVYQSDHSLEGEIADAVSEVCAPGDGGSSDSGEDDNDAISDVDNDGISDNPDDVTSSVYHEASMRKIYRNLPYLDELRPISPYRVTSGISNRFSIPKVAETLKRTYVDTMMAAIVFTQSDYFVNFSRIHPNVLRGDNGRIRMARTDNAPAVGLFTGICMHGAILDIDSIGPPQSPYDVHGITVAGTIQDTRRYMALIGAVLGYHEITGNMSENGLSFYTRGAGKNGNFSAAPAPPVVPGGHPMLSFITSVPIAGPANGSRTYPMSRSFDDRIPVYDGREGHGRKFNFTDADFQGLATWPLYRRGDAEVEQGTVVSVGHTIGTYKGSGGGLFLSTNVHFVIILGKPSFGLSSS